VLAYTAVYKIWEVGTLKLEPESSCNKEIQEMVDSVTPIIIFYHALQNIIAEE
jgi:hypothetical protein